MTKVRLLTQTFCSAVLAGIMIGIGGTVYLSSAIPAVGALLFCVGLFTICTFGLALYTGRVGHVLEQRAFAGLGITWLGNLAGTFVCGAGIAAAKPALREAALNVCLSNRLPQSTLSTLILSTLCGILMYVAVDSYKLGHDGLSRYLGMLLAVPAFILCGFEHSVADMFYFSLAGIMEQSIPFLLKATIGNAAGALLVNAVIHLISAKS